MSIITSLLIATLFIPQANDRQILNNPLANGEIAYVNGSTGESYLDIGQTGKMANRVVDESALRGYEMYELDRSEFVVLAISNLTRNASTDSLNFSNFQTGVTNTFVFTVSIPSNVKFTDVEFEYTLAKDILTGDIEDVSKIVSGNVVTVIMRDATDRESGFNLSIKNFKVIVKKYGDPDYVNDLTKKRITIRDTAALDPTLDKCGLIELGDMRKHILHYYDGNRGEDWSMYDAVSNIRFKDHDIQFGHHNLGLPLMAIGTNLLDTNVVSSTFYGRPLVNYYREADTSGVTGLHFTSNVVEVGSVSNTFSIAVSNVVFNASLLKVYMATEVSRWQAKWTQIPFTLVSSNPITIRTQKYSGGAFYRLAYGNEHVVVHVADTLKVDRFLLKGDNGSYYRIGVNSSGVLTATLAQ